MKIFIELIEHFKTLGIQQNQKHLFNASNVLALFLIGYCCCAAIAFVILIDEKTFIELGNCYYGAASMLVNFINLTSLILKQASIFELIGKFEVLMENSELSSFFLRELT